MRLIDIIACVMLVLAGVYVIVANYILLFQRLRRRKDEEQELHPVVPLIGPLLMLWGSYRFFGEMKWYFIFYFLADHATYLVVLGIPRLVIELWRSRRKD